MKTQTQTNSGTCTKGFRHLEMRLCVFSLLPADMFSSVNRLARTMLMKKTHTHTHLVSNLLDDARADLILGEGNVVLLGEVVALVAVLPHAREVPFSAKKRPSNVLPSSIKYMLK